MSPPDDTDPSPRPRTLIGEAGPYLTLGWQIALGFVFFAGLGALLDVWLDTLPWFFLGGVLLGIVSISAQIYKVTVVLGRKDALRKRRRPPSAPRRRQPAAQDPDDDWDRRWENKWSDRWGDEPHPDDEPPSKGEG